MIADFGAIPQTKRDAVKVGIVGEIFVKYSPLANNGLEKFLVSEGAEVVVPGLVDFLLYCVWNNVLEHAALRAEVGDVPLGTVGVSAFYAAAVRRSVRC